MRVTLVILASSFLLISCNTTAREGPGSSSAELKTGSLEDFEWFNQKFHTDSAFQLSRIMFPLAGESKDGLESIEWSPENWQLHTKIVNEEVAPSEVRHSYLRTDTSVTEKYWIDSSGFLVETKFALRNNKWYLVYYRDLSL